MNLLSYGLISVLGFNFADKLNRRQAKTESSLEMDDIIQVKQRHSKITAYSGPEADLKDMIASFNSKITGLQVMIGPSMVGAGKGLFLCISDEVDEVLLPHGALICDYCKGGQFSAVDVAFQNDKSVEFGFDTVMSGIVFQTRLMPLLAAIGKFFHSLYPIYLSLFIYLLLIFIQYHCMYDLNFIFE